MQRYFIGHYSPAGNHFFAYSIKNTVIDWLEPGPVTYQNDKERNVTFEGNFAQIGGTAVDVRLLTGMAASKRTDAKGDNGLLASGRLGIVRLIAIQWRDRVTEGPRECADEINNS